MGVFSDTTITGLRSHTNIGWLPSLQVNESYMLGLELYDIVAVPRYPTLSIPLRDSLVPLFPSYITNTEATHSPHSNIE